MNPAQISALLLTAALAGCAGNSAMQWRPPVPPFCGVKVCVAKVGESRCKPDDFVCSGKTANQILREMGL